MLSRSQLLAMVWGEEAHDKNLVEVRISALRRKLERHGGRLVHTVRGEGYVLETRLKRSLSSLAERKR